MPLEALRYPVTPVGLHYLLIHYDIPFVDPATFELSVGGKVARPLTLSLDDLRARPMVELEVTWSAPATGARYSTARGRSANPGSPRRSGRRPGAGRRSRRCSPRRTLSTARSRSSSPASTAASRAARSR